MAPTKRRTKENQFTRNMAASLPPGPPRRSDVDLDHIQAWCGKVDEVAVRMERRWGVDRLPRLVPIDYAKAFYSQARKFNEAVWKGSPADVEFEGQRMINAWMALDEAAHVAKAQTYVESFQPLLEARMPDGRALRVVAGHSDAKTVNQMVDNREMMVISMDEVVNLVVGFPELIKVKQLFPGSRVTSVRTMGPPTDGLGLETPEQTKERQRATGELVDDDVPF